MMKKAFVVGTYDTKGEELSYVAELIKAAGADFLTVDVSSKPSSAKVDVPNTEVAKHHPEEPGFLGNTDDRGKAVTLMSEALGEFLLSRDDLGGVIGLG
ncbi:MAG: Tm-1-like ATP-binding domain-containing protein, partial [Spirochaetaceae bacterium]